jgi:hypothetical protein
MGRGETMKEMGLLLNSDMTETRKTKGSDLGTE